MALTPQQIAANWSSKMAGAASATTAGVNAVTTSPGQAAAAQKAAYQAGVAQSVDKWATNVAAVSTESWRQSMIQKGIPHMAQGAQLAQNKVAQFHSQLQPYQASLKASLPARGPKGSNVGRMTAWHDGMMRFKKQPGT